MQQSIKKFSYLILFFIILILLAYLFSQKNKIITDQAQLTMDESNEPGSYSGNLRSLIGIGKSQTCSWEAENGAKGEVFTDGKRSYFEINNVPVTDFSGDAENTNKDEDKIGSMYTISDEEYFYSWTSVSNEGLKFKIEAINLEEDQEKNYGNENDLSQENYDFKCSFWKTDDSKFDLPAEIEFKDLSKIINY